MKLSIITINYNNLAGLKKTADSVMSQTCRDFEWIIVDGGSTDGSKEYIDGLALSLSNGTAIDGVQWSVDRFSLPGFTAADMKGVFEESTSSTSSSIENRPQRFLWCSEPDKGVYNAQNKGIVYSNGDYLLFLNSGDSFYDNTTFAQVVSSLNECKVYYGDWIDVYESKEQFGQYPQGPILYNLYYVCPIHQAMFIHRSLLVNDGYDETYLYGADRAKWIQLALDGVSFEKLSNIVCKYDRSGISSNGLMEIYIKEHSRHHAMYPQNIESLIIELTKCKEPLSSKKLILELINRIVHKVTRFFCQK